MQRNRIRNLALAATASAFLVAASVGARPLGDAKTPTPAPAHHHAAPAVEKIAAAGQKIPATGPQVQGKLMTIVGEVMDPACFLEAGPKSIGPGHYQCAMDCAKSGQTLAIYARDEDRIYFIAGELPGKNPNDPVINYVHKKVDVTGTVFHRADAWGVVILKVAPHEDKPAAPTTGVPAGK